MFIRKFFSQTITTLFFVGALYTTISAITNLTIFDFTKLTDTSVTFASERMEAFSERKSALTEKQWLRTLEQKTYISSGEVIQPTSLEEAFNLSQYLSKRVVATGYTAGVESTGKTESHPQYGITYSGTRVKRDLYSTIAADLSVFPLGTILYIPDYGFGVVADIGGAIKGNKIDLYFETVEEVYRNWGKKEVDVYVIEMGNGKVTDEDLQVLNENEAMQVFREQVKE